MAQYRFQQQYLAREREMRIQYSRSFNYNRDPYFYTPPSYRYSRGGSHYETNQYGAKWLRQAVNFGYEQGFRAGEADRQDRWASSYQDSYGYQDANYGYNGYYLQRDDYNYYFREGFRRGYEDGYDSRYQYGSYSGGKSSILADVLTGILNLQSLR
jgi:flagellar biosynthesis/type III secretory pathway protein FliH